MERAAVRKMFSHWSDTGPTSPGTVSVRDGRGWLMTRIDRTLPTPAAMRAAAFGPLRWQEVCQGRHAVGHEPGVLLAATLGSCVAVCLHDPAGRQGGMNHVFQCVQPEPFGGAAIVAEVEQLVNALMRLGARRRDLRARMAGGAHLLARGRDLGAEIAGVCLRYLEAERIPVLQATIGGNRARRALYDPVAGTLRLSHPDAPPTRQAWPPPHPGSDWERL